MKLKFHLLVFQRLTYDNDNIREKHTPNNNATRGYSWEFLIFALKIGFRALGLIGGGGGGG